MKTKSHGGARQNAGRKKGVIETKPRAKGAGRTPTKFQLDISEIGVEFSEPHTYHAEGLEIGKCSECGAVWYSDYCVNVKSNIKNDYPDSNGDLFSLLATVGVTGRKEKHLKKCSQRGNYENT